MYLLATTSPAGVAANCCPGTIGAQNAELGIIPPSIILLAVLQNDLKEREMVDTCKMNGGYYVCAMYNGGMRERERERERERYTRGRVMYTTE